MADAVALLEPSPLRLERRAAWHPILPVVGLIGLLCLTLAAYVRFLGIGFVATDSLPLIETSRFSSLAQAVDLFRKPLMAGTRFAEGEIVYRPFAALMFGLEYAVWGMNALGYHVVNLALHVVSTVMVWRLLSLLGLRWWSCVLGGGLFALHPLVVVTVPIIARLDSIAPVTAFTAGWVLVLAADQQHGIKRLLTQAGSLVLVTVAMLSKESAFVGVGLLPLLVAGRAYAEGSTWRTAVGRARIVAPHLAAAVVVFVLRYAILGSLGGGVEDPEHKFIWDRYTQALGSYTRDLTWSFSGLASSTREVWPILAGVLLLGLGLGCAYLPRRQAAVAWMGLAWLLGFALFAMAFRIMTIGWLAYFALVGVALVWAAGVEGALARLGEVLRMSHKVLGREQVSSVLLLVLLGGLGLSWLATSALVRGYEQWQFAGDVSRQYLDGLTSCASASPGVGHVRVDGMPSILDDGQAATNQMGVTLFEDYTVQSALRLLFADREYTLTVWSRETLRDVHERFSLACESDSTRVYLVASYQKT